MRLVGNACQARYRHAGLLLRGTVIRARRADRGRRDGKVSNLRHLALLTTALLTLLLLPGGPAVEQPWQPVQP